MTGLDWTRDGADWPNRETSRFYSVGGLRWHVQIAGRGPVILLLHGTGASTHSWRDVISALCNDFCVVAPDLPGHGFTRADVPDDTSGEAVRPFGRSPADDRDGYSLGGMATALSGLLAEIGLQPDIAVGHSAGAAILVRMCLDGLISPERVVSINGALMPFRSVTGPVFSALARMMARNPVIPWFVSAQAANGRLVDRLLDDTGSRIDARGVELYRRLVGDRRHVAAALRMMASWDLAPMEAGLRRLQTPLHLVVGARDRTISPDQAYEIRRLQPAADVTRLAGLGHLAHEERPDLVASFIRSVHGRAALAEAS